MIHIPEDETGDSRREERILKMIAKTPGIHVQYVKSTESHHIYPVFDTYNPR
jgi:hypothetical protein